MTISNYLRSSPYGNEWFWYFVVSFFIFQQTLRTRTDLSFFQDLDAVQGTGDKKLVELRTLGEKVSLSTSERGGKALRATVTSMEDAWNQHLANVGE